jgi:hypothetical protein
MVHMAAWALADLPGALPTRSDITRLHSVTTSARRATSGQPTADCQLRNCARIETAVGSTRRLGSVYKDKNNVIAATLTRLTNKADTSGRITKALGDGP